jgi:hypothetical protein
VQDSGHLERDGCLASSGISRKRHVKGRRFRGKTKTPPDTIDGEKRNDLLYACFHRGKADKLALEFYQHVLGVGLGEFAAQIDGVRRRGDQ